MTSESQKKLTGEKADIKKPCEVSGHKNLTEFIIFILHTGY